MISEFHCSLPIQSDKLKINSLSMAKQLFFGKTRITPFLIICINCSRIHSFLIFSSVFLSHYRICANIRGSNSVQNFHVTHWWIKSTSNLFMFIWISCWMLVHITMKIAKLFVEESHVALLEYIWMGHIPQSSFPIVVSVSVKFCTRKNQFECP